MKKKREAKYRPEEVIAYISEKGWKYTLEGFNYKIQTCIFCQNSKGNFEIQKDKGFYKTWCCGEQGSFYDLRKSQGDLKGDQVGISRAVDDEPTITDEKKDLLTGSAMNFHNKIYVRQEALQYLKGRGFTDKTIRHFKLGCQKKNGTYWLTIPHFENEKAVNIKYRTIPPADKKWRQEDGGKKVLFNSDVIDQHDSIIITEGELKTVALWQMGFENSVSLTGGVQNFRPEWFDRLEKVRKVYICMDADPAGVKGAEELAMRLGPERCYNVVLDAGKDPDDYFFTQGKTAEDFQALLKKAKLYNIRNLISANEAFSILQAEMETEDENKVHGLMTPWDEVNKLTRGFKPGELIVLGAPPKVGKTTFALDIALYQAAINNPVLFFCIEMGATRIVRKMTCNLMQVEDQFLEADDVAGARYKLRRHPIYLADRVRRGIEPEEIFDSIKLAYRRYGLKFVVFDNLHFLVRSTDKLREEIGQVSQGFKLLAEELRIPIMLIVHPRKLNRNRIMTADDFKETGAMHADADQILILHRDRKRLETMEDMDMDDPNNKDDDTKDALLSPETQVIVDASRFTEGGRTVLYYEGAMSKYLSMEKKRKETR